MRIMRWRADRKPTTTEVEAMFKDEGLEYIVEDLAPGSVSKEHKHPFDEIRIVIQGAMRFNVLGNEFILREGDRLELPSNTRHHTLVEPDVNCVSIYAHKVF